MVLISTYHSLIFFTIASLHFISSIQFKICCQNKSFRCSSLGNTYNWDFSYCSVCIQPFHNTIILLFPLTSSNLCNPMCIFIKVFLHIIRLSLHTSHYTVWFYLLPQSLLSLPHFPCEHPRLSKYFHRRSSIKPHQSNRDLSCPGPNVLIVNILLKQVHFKLLTLLLFYLKTLFLKLFRLFFFKKTRMHFNSLLKLFTIEGEFLSVNAFLRYLV